MKLTWISDLFSKSHDSDLVKELSNDEFDKIKFQARVALIDDEEVTHVDRLKNDGYNISHFPDIVNIDDFIRKKYHVVILDIQGIGKDISPQSEGWGVLKYLKTEFPHLVVIMFTGAEWSITKYKDQANLADDFIGKDLEFLDFKAKLDAGIKKAFSPGFHFDIEKRKLAIDINNAQAFEKITEILQKYGRNKSKALKEVKKITTDSDVIQTVDNYLSIVGSIFTLLA
jgi:DNA-binding NtrC family response regulator